MSWSPADAPTFYRVHEQANLQNVDLHGAVITNAILGGANLAGANLSNACFVECDLAGATMSNATFAQTDFSLSDLGGAAVAASDLTNCVLLNTVMPNGMVQTDDADAELMALELSGQALAPRDVYLQLRGDLSLIRQAFSTVAAIHHFPRWTVGEMLAEVTAAQIAAINASQYGPIAVRPVVSDWYDLRFQRHYNPEVLSGILKAQFGAQAAQPAYNFGDGNDIQFNSTFGVYTFSRGWGDCTATCTFRHFWDFLVQQGGVVVLLREYGTPLP